MIKKIKRIINDTFSENAVILVSFPSFFRGLKNDSLGHKNDGTKQENVIFRFACYE
jgi:hypothetical protein